MAVEDSDSFDLKRPPEGMRNPFRDINSDSLDLVRNPGGMGYPLRA